jgi:hypothetical protein
MGMSESSVFSRMNERQKLQCLEIQNEHLAVLATDFRNPMNSILSAARWLEKDFLGEAQLSKDEKAKFIGEIISVTGQYLEFIEHSLSERKAFIRSVMEQDGDV